MHVISISRDLYYEYYIHFYSGDHVDSLDNLSDRYLMRATLILWRHRVWVGFLSTRKIYPVYKDLFKVSKITLEQTSSKCYFTDLEQVFVLLGSLSKKDESLKSL